MTHHGRRRRERLLLPLPLPTEDPVRSDGEDIELGVEIVSLLFDDIRFGCISCAGKLAGGRGRVVTSEDDEEATAALRIGGLCASAEAWLSRGAGRSSDSFDEKATFEDDEVEPNEDLPTTGDATSRF